MTTWEIKFVFEGIIFSSPVLISRASGSVNRYEFTVSFLNRYLISKYRKCYCLIWENNRFIQMEVKNEKERELIKILQETIRGTLLPGKQEVEVFNQYQPTIAQ